MKNLEIHLANITRKKEAGGCSLFPSVMLTLLLIEGTL